VPCIGPLSFELEESLLVGKRISVLSLASACAVSLWFTNIVVGEIESGLLIDPVTKTQGWICSDGALTLMDRDRLLE
jgi:hypothetical protein